MGTNFIFYTEMNSKRYDQIQSQFKNRFQGFPVWSGKGWIKHNYVDKKLKFLPDRNPFDYMWVELVRGTSESMIPCQEEKELYGLQTILVNGDFMDVLKDFGLKLKAEGIEDLTRYLETPEFTWTAAKWYLPAYEHTATIERILESMGEKVS